MGLVGGGVTLLGNNVTADILLETMKARRKWNSIIKILRGWESPVEFRINMKEHIQN